MEPVTREEMYLAAAAGEDVSVPEPVTRRDMYMKALIDKGGGSGGASVPAIIDVVELPTQNIKEDAFYRLLTGTFVFNQFSLPGWTCHCVTSLPDVGEPVTTDMQSGVGYYNLADGDVYGYIDTTLAGTVGVSVGWYTFTTLGPLLGTPWSGVITDIMEDPMDETTRLLLEYVVYSYKDGWTSLKGVGRPGTGASAEVFNHPSNIAEGVSSHAEGVSSHAEGYSSHAEGVSSHAGGASSHAEGGYSYAEGDSSHAEGVSSHAEGISSHAEGVSSYAEGYSSHAEGVSSHAEGDYSHAEGYSSHALGRSQHVQGEYNIVDPDGSSYELNVRGRYAHIVGNGTSETKRSNAHTLDWKGNAWFAGGVILTSPDGTRYKITIEDGGTLNIAETTD